MELNTVNTLSTVANRFIYASFIPSSHLVEYVHEELPHHLQKNRCGGRTLWILPSFLMLRSFITPPPPHYPLPSPLRLAWWENWTSLALPMRGECHRLSKNRLRVGGVSRVTIAYWPNKQGWLRVPSPFTLFLHCSWVLRKRPCLHRTDHRGSRRHHAGLRVRGV